MSAAVALRRISKHFGPLVAVNDATLEVKRGEIHALLGDNGAGKTSLMNVLAGVYRADAGSIDVDGKPAPIHSPQDARRAGIGMVHQEQRLVARFTAPENVVLGHPEPRWLVLRRSLQALAVRLSARHGVAIDARRRVGDLSLGWRQRLEVVKLLHHGARVLVLDEPTANLGPAEVETLFETLRGLVAEGRSVIFITHKLDEALRYADRVSLMRDGRIVHTLGARETSRDALYQLMYAAAPDARPASRGVPSADVVLEVRGLRVADSGGAGLWDVHLEVHRGEVVAVAGVAGPGQTLLAEAITGHTPEYAGSITIVGRDIRGLGARAVTDLGVAYVPEDRRNVGLMPGLSVALNLALREYRRPPMSRAGWLDHRAVRRSAVEAIERYAIRPADPDLPAGKLSGGNQQRLVLARELSDSPALIVAHNLTRGLDAHSSAQVIAELLAQRERGAAVVWITSDPAEAHLCDRVAVIADGRLVAARAPSASGRGQG